MISTLTPREVEVLQYVVQGMNNRQIAQKLIISHHTAKSHVCAILKNLTPETKLGPLLKPASRAFYVINGGLLKKKDWLYLCNKIFQIKDYNLDIDKNFIKIIATE